MLRLEQVELAYPAVYVSTKDADAWGARPSAVWGWRDERRVQVGARDAFISISSPVLQLFTQTTPLDACNPRVHLKCTSDVTAPLSHTRSHSSNRRRCVSPDAFFSPPVVDPLVLAMDQTGLGTWTCVQNDLVVSVENGSISLHCLKHWQSAETLLSPHRRISQRFPLTAWHTLPLPGPILSLTSNMARPQTACWPMCG